MHQRLNKDVLSNKIFDNETWNTCPNCGKNYPTKPAIPGILHRTKTCNKCLYTVTELAIEIK